MNEFTPMEEAPEQDQPCEYIIEVRCKGWYRPANGKPMFAPDDREPPSATMKFWKPWKDAQSWEEGFLAVRDFRNQKSDENDG